MKNQRNRLIGLAIKYGGEYSLIIKAIKNHEEAYSDYQNCITILDDSYPNSLRKLEEPPLVLFFKGNIELLNTRMCGVVGSRKITETGKETTIFITSKLKNNYTIVSGLAKGVDAVAHLEALDFKTIGVLGSGIDYIYPIENKNLYDMMNNHQLIISEYPGNSKPLSHHFPLRNRIISALSEFIVVTQASLKSGTFITVNYALSLNKNVYVCPYHLFQTEGIGNNQLIEEGANILTYDVLMYLQTH